jgi:hypothetical protein
MTTAAKPRRRSRPVTARPWFPGALGLWFAALFGLTSLVVPPAVLERFVTTIGLDRVLTAAAPPLGETARLLIAVAASAVGEIVGLLIGRALARKPNAGVTAATFEAEDAEAIDAPWPPPERRAQERRFEAPRRPLFASEDLVLPQVDAAPALAAPHPEPEPEPELAPPEPKAALPPLAAAPLEDLGAAQLTERLALALTSRKARGEGVPAGLGNRLGALAGLEAARLGTQPASAEDEDELDEDEAVGDESSYSSLLDIGPHRAAMRHAEPEPEEVFDDEDDEDAVAVMPIAPLSPSLEEEEDETDRALRRGLDSLQRLSNTR